jgi:hypothetical protein
MLASGCAGAVPLPPAKALQPSDLASLAGEWQGTLRGTLGAGHRAGESVLGRVVVAPDGSYTSNINGVPGVGRARIEGGKIVFEGSTTRGTATLHEGDGRRILRGEGTWVGLDGNSTFELTRP